MVAIEGVGKPQQKASQQMRRNLKQSVRVDAVPKSLSVVILAQSVFPPGADSGFRLRFPFPFRVRAWLRFRSLIRARPPFTCVVHSQALLFMFVLYVAWVLLSFPFLFSYAVRTHSLLSISRSLFSFAACCTEQNTWNKCLFCFSSTSITSKFSQLFGHAQLDVRH